ncbi:MAG: GTP-binding protein [Eubacteriales bacterium]
MKKPIEIYVVSGFLGSGKTTFLTQFIDSFSDKKVGILVNELGAVSIDGILIEQSGIQMREITSGSIYCYCKQGDFIKVLKSFSMTDIDVLIIENSGMADPSNIHGLLKQGEEVAGRSYDYKGAVCILDAMTFLNHVEVLPSIGNQVKCSNFIIINKIDMVTEAQLRKCRAKILEINEEVNVIEAVYSQVQMEEVKKRLVDNGYDAETTNKCYNKFMSYAIECDKNVTEEEITKFVELVKDKLYRVKGFAKIETGWLQIDAMEKQVLIKEVNLQKKQKLDKTRIVVIGRDETEFKEWLLAMWKESVDTLPKIYE